MKPGGRIPVDGVVLRGRSFVEQAAITGEAMPVEKASGDVVYAGTINQSGALESSLENSDATRLSEGLLKLSSAEKSRAPIQKTADRLAGYLVYFALEPVSPSSLLTMSGRPFPS